MSENDQLIKNIIAFQTKSMVHPLTCGKDSMHNNLIPFVENGIVKLKCPDCDYIQEIHPELYKIINNVVEDI